MKEYPTNGNGARIVPSTSHDQPLEPLENYIVRIIKQRLWREGKSKETSDYIYGLPCQECGEYEAYFGKGNGHSCTKCSRENNCGAHCKILTTEEWMQWQKPFKDRARLYYNATSQASKNNDFAETKHYKAAAKKDARNWLSQVRGISRETLEKIDVELTIYTFEGVQYEAIAYKIKRPDGQKYTHYRLIDPPKGIPKTLAGGKQQGFVWRHPEPKDGPLLITGGIEDALALDTFGFNAIALMGEGRGLDSIDDAITEAEWKEAIIALDGDKAGIDAAKRLQEQLRKKYSGTLPKVIFPRALHDEKGPKDWNEVLLRREEFIEQEREKWEKYGEINLIENVHKYVQECCKLRIYISQGFLPFKENFYHIEIIEKKEGDKTEKESRVTLCAQNLKSLRPIYQIEQPTGADEYTYKTKVEAIRGDKLPRFFTEDLKELSNGSYLKKTLSGKAGVNWRLKSEALQTVEMIDLLHSSKDIPIAREASVFGAVDKKSGSLIFPSGALTEKGDWIPAKKPEGSIEDRQKNKEENKSFKGCEIHLSRKEWVIWSGTDQAVRPTMGKGLLPFKFIGDLFKAYEINGIVALGTTLASFHYSEKITGEDYPITYAKGKPQSGKTTLFASHLFPFALKNGESVAGDSTMAAYLQDMIQYENSPVIIDDLRNDSLVLDGLLQFIRGYNRGHSVKRGVPNWGDKNNPREFTPQVGLFISSNDHIFHKPEERQRMLYLEFPDGLDQAKAEISERMMEEYPDGWKAAEGLMLRSHPEFKKKAIEHYKRIREKLNTSSWSRQYAPQRRLIRGLSLALGYVYTYLEIREEKGCPFSGHGENGFLNEFESFFREGSPLHEWIETNVKWFGDNAENKASFFLDLITTRKDTFKDWEKVDNKKAIPWGTLNPGKGGREALCINLSEATAYLRQENLLTVPDEKALGRELEAHSAFYERTQDKFSAKMTNGRRAKVNTMRFWLDLLEGQEDEVAQ